MIEMDAELQEGLERVREAVFARFDTLSDRIGCMEAKINRPGAGGHSRPGEPGYSDSSAAQKEKKAFAMFARTGDDREIKGMSVGDDTAGGYLDTPTLSDMINKRLFDQSPMRRISRTVTISLGSLFQEPKDTSDIGATWVGEKQSRPETTASQFGQLEVVANELYANIQVTQTLLDDSRFDIGTYITNKIADKFGREEGKQVILGDGLKMPQGILTYATSAASNNALTDDTTRAPSTLTYVPTGTATSLSADSLKSLFYAVRAVHRTNATWLMSSATANVLDTLKDGVGQYLWRTSMAAGAPPTLLGKPVEFCEDMPQVMAGSFPIAFGDFSVGYLLVDKVGVKILRDPFSNKPFVGFYATRRVGGAVANFDAIKLLKIAVS